MKEGSKNRLPRVDPSNMSKRSKVVDEARAFLVRGKNCQNKTLRPNLLRFHTTRLVRRPSGPHYLLKVLWAPEVVYSLQQNFCSYPKNKLK